MSAVLPFFLRNLPDESRVGYCACGCGAETPISDKTNKKQGYVKGQPRQFIPSHHQINKLKYDVDPDSGCWLWRTTFPSGYGMVSVNRGAKRAHRVMFEFCVGPIPEGMVLDHICRVKNCVNPQHLRVVTVLENTRIGLSAKLDEEKVREIRKLDSEGVSIVELMDRFNISRSRLWSIRAGKAWTDVE